MCSKCKEWAAEFRVTPQISSNKDAVQQGWTGACHECLGEICTLVMADTKMGAVVVTKVP